MNDYAQTGRAILILAAFPITMVILVFWPWLAAILGGIAVVAAIELSRRGKRKLHWLALGTAGLAVFALSFVSQSVLAEQAANERQEAVAQASQQRHRELEYRATKAAERNEATRWAARWGITTEQYQRLEELRYGAHSACQHAVREQARWTAGNAPRGFLSEPDFTWSAIDESRIRIVAQDVRMTNGFSGARDVRYSCLYDADSGTATVEQIE